MSKLAEKRLVRFCNEPVLYCCKKRGVRVRIFFLSSLAAPSSPLNTHESHISVDQRGERGREIREMAGDFNRASEKEGGGGNTTRELCDLHSHTHTHFAGGYTLHLCGTEKPTLMRTGSQPVL